MASLTGILKGKRKMDTLLPNWCWWLSPDELMPELIGEIRKERVCTGKTAFAIPKAVGDAVQMSNVATCTLTTSTVSAGNFQHVHKLYGGLVPEKGLYVYERVARISTICRKMIAEINQPISRTPFSSDGIDVFVDVDLTGGYKEKGQCDAAVRRRQKRP